MTPKEKAKELVSKFLDCEVESTEMFNAWIDYQLAKQCALIAVVEIIKSINPFGMFLGKDYWEEVKQEIENL
jgi:hypothetical protein